MNTEVTEHLTSKGKRFQRGQGLAEYSLIIALVGLACVIILATLGKGTKSTIQKVTCAAGSTDPQCSCVNEKITVTSSFTNGCSGTSLLVTVTSSCSGTTLTVNNVNYSNPAAVNWASAPTCPVNPTTTTFALKSTQPDGTVKNYTVSRP